jgi:HSP20 family protein
MSVFFPREFNTIFRLADEIEKASRHQGQQCSPVRTFKPKFDAKENEHTFELLGELPGVDQKDINIEWLDEHTIAVSGRAESRSETSSPAEKPAEDQAAEETQSETASYHRPSVEDEFVEVESEKTVAEATAAKAEETKQAEQPAQPKAKWWVTERSTGSFRRTFTFPGRVDRDAVTASLKNGVLLVTIPKAAPLEPRRITVY